MEAPQLSTTQSQNLNFLKVFLVGLIFILGLYGTISLQKREVNCDANLKKEIIHSGATTAPELPKKS